MTHVGIILACINTMEHGGIALAFTLSKTLKALLLYGVLKFKLGDIRAARMGRFLLKIAVATGVMMAVMAGYNAWFGAQFDLTAFVSKALLIATSGSVGVLVFFAATIMLKVQEIHHVVHTIIYYIKTHRMTS
jgi:peptidoglycan biosynthesis protein MviN/MurJ (putative lipid II flippase)